jgi:hypothetical protein
MTDFQPTAVDTMDDDAAEDAAEDAADDAAEDAAEDAVDLDSKPEPDALVQDPQALLSVMCRLHATNDALIVWNCDRAFKILVRNDPTVEDGDSYAVEVAILCDEDEPEGERMARCLELEHDGYMEEPGVFAIDTIVVRRHPDHVRADLRRAAKLLNEVHAYMVCRCGQYLIKDANFLTGEAKLCLACQLTARPGDLELDFCPICMEKTFKRHMTATGCCGQRLHVSCLDVWRAKQQTCPLCRHV